MSSRYVRVVVATGFAAITLAACSSTPNTRPVASAQSGGGTTSTSATPQSALQELHRWGDCMRQHGVQISDPTLNAQNVPQFSQSQMAGIPESVKTTAQQACRSIIADLLSNPSGNKSVDPQRVLAVSRCMRSHGVPDFPDPDPTTNVLYLTPTIRNEPGYQQAWQACKSATPGGGNG